MPNYVDDRIVSMQFDNSEFDPNIKKSQKTLEEFEKSLDTKKFEKYADRLNGTDFTPIEKSLTVLGNSFKAMETVVTGAMLNVGMHIENFVARQLKSLAIEPITAGWGKYGTKVSAVQTIMAATSKQFEDTGEQLEYVKAQLNELNRFTDETSYSFSDMVSNISKFTSKGINLDTAVAAMEGISTWAALSGQGTESAAHAMYNLSQAIGQGYLKFIDWKSIQIANMDTVEFKETAIETAKALGTLKEQTDGTFKTLKGNSVTVKNFEQNLSDAWLTTDVLMKTLEKYGGFAQKLIDSMEKTGLSAEKTLKAIDAYREDQTKLDEIIKETGGDAEELKKVLIELGTEEYDLGRKAFRASYEAKTLAEAINYVKDAVSTGWITSFEYIFGDYKQAKEFWTWFSNDVLYNLIVRTGELRNDMLAFWNAMGGREDLIDSLKNIWEAMKNIGSIIRDILSEYFPQLKDGETIASNLAAILIAVTRRFKAWTESLKENKELMDAVRSGARILGNVLKGILEIARLLYIFLGPTVRFTKELFSNTMKLLKPISDGVDEVSDLKNVVEGLRIAFLVLGTAVALPIKILSIFFNKISEIGNMTLPELLDKIKGWAKGVWESIKGLFTNSIELAKNVVEGFKNGFSNGFKALGDFIKGVFTGLIEIVKKVLGIHSPSTVFFAIGAFVIAGLILGIASMSDKLKEGLEKVIGIFKNFASALVQIAMMVIVGIAVFKVVNAIAGIATGISNIFKSISNFFNLAGNALNTYAKNKFKAEIIKSIGKTALMIAAAITIVAGAIAGIAYLTNIVTPDAMKKALWTVGIISGVLVALVAGLMIVNKVLSSKDTNKITVGGKLLQKIGINIKSISTSTNSLAKGMMQLAGSFILLSVSLSALAFAVVGIAAILKDKGISVGTLFALAGFMQLLVTVLGSFMGLSIFIQKMNLDPAAFKQLKKYMTFGMSALLSVALLTGLLTAMDVSWKAVAQLAVISALVSLLGAIFIGLGALMNKANIPIAVLGKVALIVGIVVTAILTLTVSLALLGPALSMLVDGMEKFEPYLMKFNENAGILLTAMGKFILFSFMLSVASVFLSVAFVNIGIGLSTLIPIILALMGLGSMIAHVFKSLTDAFDKAINNIVKSAKTFLKNYKLLELALEAFKNLMTWDLVGPIAILVALSFALTNLGVAGLIAAGGLTLLILNAKLAAACIDDLKKAMSFFETITTEQIVGMAKLALGIGALGLAATLTAPGIATLAASVLLVAAAIYVLVASTVLLGNNMKAADATLKFLIKHVNDFIKLVTSVEAAMIGLGFALGVIGAGAIILAVGLTLTAVATLALCINFGIAILLLLAFNAVMNKIKEDNPKLYDSIMDVVTAIGNMATAISDLVQLIVPIVKIITAIVVAAAKAVIKAVLAIYKWWTENIQPKIEAIKSFFSRIWNGIVTWWQTNVQPKFDSIKSFFVGIWNGLVKWWQENVHPKLESIQSFFATIWNSIKKWWRDNIERGGAKKKIEEWANNIINWFKNPFGFNEDGTSKTFGQFAKGCVDGFINGITNLYYYCKGKIEEWGQKIVGWFSGKGGIDSNSPSKKFIYYGEMSVLGYVQGIEDNSNKAKDAMNDLAEVAKEAFCDPMGIHSRSAVMYDAGYESVHGYADGVRENSDLAIKAMDKLVEDVNKSAEGLDDLPSGKKKALDLSIARDEELEQDYKATIKYQDKSITGALGNLWDDIKNIWSKLTSGQIKIGEALSALWGSIKEHGGNFLGDKFDSIKNWVFGKGGILEGLGDLLKDSFGNLGIDKILKELQNMDFKDITDSIGNLDLSGVVNAVPDLYNIGKSVGSGTTTGQQQYVFTQNNYSPKALSRLEIYRQTKRQFYDFKTQEELSR